MKVTVIPDNEHKELQNLDQGEAKTWDYYFYYRDYEKKWCTEKQIAPEHPWSSAWDGERDEQVWAGEEVIKVLHRLLTYSRVYKCISNNHYPFFTILESILMCFIVSYVL